MKKYNILVYILKSFFPPINWAHFEGRIYNSKGYGQLYSLPWPQCPCMNVSGREPEVRSCEVNTFILFSYFANLGSDMFVSQSWFFSKSFLTLIASLSCSKAYRFQRSPPQSSASLGLWHLTLLWSERVLWILHGPSAALNQRPLLNKSCGIRTPQWEKSNEEQLQPSDRWRTCKRAPKERSTQEGIFEMALQRYIGAGW